MPRLFSTNENAAFQRISRSVEHPMPALAESIEATNFSQLRGSRHLRRRNRSEWHRSPRGAAGMAPPVSADEPEASTCGDAFNNAWACYCASPRARGASFLSSSVNRERARSPSADSRSAPLLSPAAPAFQMTRYYRYGELDTCDGRWAAIWACMDRSKRYVRLDRRRNISTARLVRVRSQNSTRTKKLTPSRFPRLTQGRPGAEREGTGARAGGSGAGEAVLDPDGPRGGGAAVAETVRR